VKEKSRVTPGFSFEAMRILEFKNDGSKLCRQLLSLVDFRQGNNYENTHIRVEVHNDSLVVSTFCANEFGREWSNENHTRVERSHVPFFAAKKLGLL
jgi:hypothetical protein